MSTFSVTRAANGQIVVSLQNLENYNVKDVGTMSGNVSISSGHTTGASNESVLQIGQTSDAGSLKFEAASTNNNLDFYGQNIDADFNTRNANPYNVSWEVHNGTFDSTKSSSSVIFESSEDSYNNLIKLGTAITKSLGKYDNLISDNGKNNTYVASDTSTSRVETTAKSTGAVVEAGNGLNDFYIGGSLGVFKGGSATDSYTTDKDTAKQNLMLGEGGNDVISDYGQNSLFVGGAGTDTANMYGKYGVANLGFDEAGNFTFGNGSLENSVFTGESQTDASGKVYKYEDVLKLRGWSAADFLSKSNIGNNPYYNLIKQEIEETLG